RARGLHGAAVPLDYVAYDRESEAEPAVLPRDRAIGLSKPVEDVRRDLGREAVAGVGDGEAEVVARARDAHLDASARGRELHGVREEIGDDLLETVGVGLDTRQVGLDLAADDDRLREGGGGG